MVAEVYLSGRLKNDSGCVVTLSSSAVLFVVEYCAPVDVRIIFVEDAAAQREEQIELPLYALQKLHHTFTETELLPLIIQNCQLPVIFDPQIAMVRSGLCCAVRHLVKLADATNPTKYFKDLLVINSSLKVFDSMLNFLFVFGEQIQMRLMNSSPCLKSHVSLCLCKLSLIFMTSPRNMCGYFVILTLSVDP